MTRFGFIALQLYGPLSTFVKLSFIIFLDANKWREWWGLGIYHKSLLPSCVMYAFLYVSHKSAVGHDYDKMMRWIRSLMKLVWDDDKRSEKYPFCEYRRERCKTCIGRCISLSKRHVLLKKSFKKPFLAPTRLDNDNGVVSPTWDLLNSCRLLKPFQGTHDQYFLVVGANCKLIY